MITLASNTERDTIRLGHALAMAIDPGEMVGLSGPLGAGKSVLARAFVRALCKEPRLEVASPTYTLCNVYEAAHLVAHIDLYRLSSPEELDELGVDDAFEAGIAIIEWPENGFESLPVNSVHVEIEPSGDDTRKITISGNREILTRIERSLQISTFLETAGFGDALRTKMSADASARGYEFILPDKGKPWFLMDAPKMPDGPPVRDGKPYSQIAHLAEDMTAFVAIGELLHKRGFAAPEIRHFDLDKGFALIESLGDELVIDENRVPIAERYLASAEFLARLHQEQFDNTTVISNGTPYTIPPYDHQAMMIEAELFTDWYVPWKSGQPMDEAPRQDFRAIWMRLFRILDEQDKTLVLRDFHSPNILWREHDFGHRRVGVIDFQDALIGPTAYDVASIAQDARVDVSPDLETAILNNYIKSVETSRSGFNREHFMTGYKIITAQRATKLLGIFVRLKERDGKAQYLQHLPRMKDYLERSLSHPVLAEYREWLGDVTKL